MRRRLWVASGATAASMLVLGAGSAFACNLATTNGVNSSGCSVTWQAESVDSTSASLYPPGLLQNTDGTPTLGGAGGGNGGYVSEVSPAVDSSDPGVLEINHFSAGASDIQIRIPVATTYAMNDALLTVTLPAVPSGAAWTLTPSSQTAVPSARWGASYAPFAWSASNASPTVPSDGGTFTVDLGPMAAGQGTVIQFSANDATPSDRADNLLDYKASLSGQYASSDCTLASPRSVTTTTPGTPAVTRTLTTPGTPAVYTTVPAHHRALAQIDTFRNFFAQGSYTPAGLRRDLAVRLTPSQIRERNAARRHDERVGRLVYRRGSAARWLWGSTTTGFRMIDECSLPPLSANQDLWILGHGATRSAPWGPSHSIVQTAARANCAPHRILVKAAVPPRTTTVIVTPAVPPISTTTTTYWCGSTEVAQGTGCFPATN